MYKRGDREFIVDMFLACWKILDYTEDMTFEEFLSDDKTLDAVVRNIEILGEAVKGISKEFREKYQDIEWNKIARTRDKLIHFYFGVNPEITWRIVKMDIPILLEKLGKIIKERGWEDVLDL